MGKTVSEVASVIKASKRPLQLTFFRSARKLSSTPRFHTQRARRKPPLHIHKLDLHNASEEGDAPLLSQLLSNSSSPQELNKVNSRTGDSPAHRAASKGHLRVLDMLIDAGAAINKTR